MITPEKIRLGFEVGSGNPIYLPLHHAIITGMTRLSGKTTTLEGLVERSGLKAITFRTKRGEIGFEKANKMPLYFDDSDLTEWRALEGLMEATLEEKVRREPGVRAALIRLCREPTPAKSLREIYERIVAVDEDPKTRGFMKDVYTKLRAYLEVVIPQIERLAFVKSLRLESSANMMDLVEDGLSDEMQNLILYGVLKRIYESERDTVIVIPEAWKFIPQDRGSPCKPIVEKLIREGGAVGNYLWIDSQDLRGVDKKYTRSIDNWILGRQRDEREVEATLKAIPQSKKPESEQIMTLGLGQFFACLHDDVWKVYVQPAWMDEETARAIALGKLRVEDVGKPELGDEDMVWKEEAEKLRIENEKLRKDNLSLQNEYDKLYERIETVEKELPVLRESAEELKKAKENVDTVRLFIESLKKLLDYEISGTRVRDIDFNTAEVTVQLSPTERTVELDAEKSFQGKILQVLLTDLKDRKSVTTVDVSKALEERGWPRSKDSVRGDFLTLIRSGLVIKEGTNYRLPKGVKVTLKETVPL